MLVRTKKHHTESVRFVGSPAAIERLGKRGDIHKIIS